MRKSYSQPLARDAMAYVLAGGRGSRLKELTDNRAKPAVYFGGVSRIIDFALSNAINSGIRRIGVATQYKAHSLIRHMNRAWNFMRPERNESFDILPASQRISELLWYEGTADAVYQNIDIIQAHAPKHMVILAGDHIYKMDYELMLQQHVNSGADVTVGCLVVPKAEATGFGVMAVDENSVITSFVEKPAPNLTAHLPCARSRRYPDVSAIELTALQLIAHRLPPWSRCIDAGRPKDSSTATCTQELPNDQSRCSFRQGRIRRHRDRIRADRRRHRAGDHRRRAGPRHDTLRQVHHHRHQAQGGGFISVPVRFLEKASGNRSLFLFPVLVPQPLAS